MISSPNVHAGVLSGHATAITVLGELGEGLEAPVQLLYLISLLGFVVVGAYLVVRQVSTLRKSCPSAVQEYAMLSFSCSWHATGDEMAV